MKANMVIVKRKNSVSPGTVRVMKNGDTRLSSDLAKAGDKFVPAVVWKNNSPILHLLHYDEQKHSSEKSLTAWDSNDKAESPMISLGGTLRALGLSPEKVKGEYKAEVSKEGITIRFGKR